ncbi:MAG: glycine cleavage system aminomethyltransferase GcvT, partial [Microthrixaceae bacterium]
LGTVAVRGPGAQALLQAKFTNDLTKVAPGRAQYTHLLDDDGSVLDDIIVWWLGDETFDVMPNASNTDRVVAALSGAGTTAVDSTDQRAVMAIQGPTARELLAAVSSEAAEIGRFRVGSFEFLGHECTVAGTGYTGSDGVECAVPIEIAESFWASVLDSGVQPAGLGARDTLRLEAGLPLHGQELGDGITPLNAGLDWVVAFEKGDFAGRGALLAQREAGVDPILRGLRTEGRRPPRTGQPVLADGDEVGHITSGNFSPMLERGIAMALVSPQVTVGDEVTIDARGTEVPAKVVDMPFWTP